MNTPLRFEEAIGKLYKAFHNNELNPECCRQCAVGNILDNRDQWKYFTDGHGSLKLTYVGLVNEKFGKKYNGYSPMELLQIEATFLKGCGFALPLRHGNSKPDRTSDKDMLFMGLSAVVEFLCELEQIPNVMDCSELFDYELSHASKLTTAITV